MIVLGLPGGNWPERKNSINQLIARDITPQQPWFQGYPLKNMEEQYKQMIESYINSYNNFDIDGMVKNLAEDIVFENVSNGKVDVRTEGLKDFSKQAESAKHYFKQRKQTIESWDLNDSTVTVHIDYQAILAIDLPNGLKSGDTLKLKGSSVFEFTDGKIKRITDRS